jgi:hypothetical protein
MKTYLLFLLFFCSSVLLFAQNDVLVKTLNPQKCPNVKIKVPNSLIKQEAWDDGEIRVDIMITSDLPAVVLEALLKAGRYELFGEKDGEEYYNITASAMEIPLYAGEAQISESVDIKVSTPEYFSMNDQAILYKDVNESVVQARSDTREEMAAVLKKMKAIREDINIHLKVVSTSDKAAVDLSTFMFILKGENVAADKISFR